MAVIEPSPVALADFALRCDPNPFCGEATLHLRAPGSQPLQLMIFDELGRRVRRWDVRQAGLELHWNGTDEDGVRLPASVYYGRLETNDLELVERLVFMR